MTILQNSAFKVQAEQVPDVYQLKPEAGAMVINEPDGKLYWSDGYFWAPQGEDILPAFQLFFTEFQVRIIFKAPALEPYTIHWGDGTVTNTAGNGTSPVTVDSNYSDKGYNAIWITGNLSLFTYFYVYGPTVVNYGDFELYGKIDKWVSLMPNLTDFALPGSKVGGDIAQLATLPLLSNINVSYNSAIYGDINQLRNLPLIALAASQCDNLTFDGSDPWLDTVGNIFVMIGSNQPDSKFTGRMVDNAIESFKNVTGYTLYVRSSNSRTPASNAALKTYLDNNTFLVLTNSANVSGLTYGPELHTDANAASDSIGEADAVTGWTPTGLGSPNEFISQSIQKRVGKFAFKVNANPNPTANAQIAKTFTIISGNYYQWAFKVRHLGNGQGNYWQPRYDSSLIRFAIYDWEDFLGFQDIQFYIKSASTSISLIFREGTSGNNGGIYLDDVSLKSFS